MESKQRQVSVIFAACALGVAVLIAGCNGPSLTPAAGASAPQTKRAPLSALGTPVDETKRNHNLLYAGAGNGLFVYTYPHGTFVNEPVSVAVGSLCTDKKGDVYVPEYKAVLEFAHGASQPTREIKGGAAGCAVDPGSGNLALVTSSKIAIYEHASGNPTYYSYHKLAFGAPGYDDNGNLFVEASPETRSAVVLLELPSGGSKLKLVFLQQKINEYLGRTVRRNLPCRRGRRVCVPQHLRHLSCKGQRTPRNGRKFTGARRLVR